MPQWNEVQEKARKLIDEGMRLLRSGMSDAEFLAEATASAAKLHVSIRKNRYDKYRALHDLGVIVKKACDDGRESITVTPEMKHIVEQVKNLDAEVERAEVSAAQLTVVRKEPKEARPDEPTQTIGE